MKKLATSRTIAQVGLLKGMLEQEGIDCVIKNENLIMASGFLPFTECFPELWLVHDEDFAKALTILDRWQPRELEEEENWDCVACGVENEGQFAACWNCGHEPR